jgi:phenylpyruvate tautomerase PptA (4-oxalocrotonate tautomerase family)
MAYASDVRGHPPAHNPREDALALCRNLRRNANMPMIDVYAVAGTFGDPHALAQQLAAAVMRWEQVPTLPLFTNNTAAFIHDMDPSTISNVDGDNRYVRIQVLTPVGVLDRDKQLGVVEELTQLVADAASDPTLRDRTWVLLTESPEGGWGIGGHANTNADIAHAARAQITAAGSGPGQPTAKG